ncbi:MAG TPA: hypothetical protein VF533_11565, partial [Solirubrobacteraceae bacterium]
MHPVQIDPALLRRQLPELILRPGMSVVARVASRGAGAVGALILGGQLIRATVPQEVRTGDVLRLSVAEVTAERVVLKLESTTPEPGAHSAAAAPAPVRADPAAPAVQPLPPTFAPGPPPALAPRPDADPDARGGEGDRRGGGGRAGVSLAYETPALGRLDIRLERGPEGVTATIGAGATAYALAHARAEAL